MELKVGMSHQIDIEVSAENTADNYGSGDISVYATPHMILQMEKVAALAVKPALDERMSTVGTKVDIEHIAATPTGIIVSVKAVLKEIDGKRLVFDVSAWDKFETVGRGIHERFIVNKERFLAKAEKKSAV